jgi:BirA family biotin operon repressor/biotin-[acetyl-CoA-carboxylase] ligase
MSVVLHDPPAPLPLLASVAVADVAGAARDDQVAERRARRRRPQGRRDPRRGPPRGRWAVLGIGVNVAVRPGDLPEELRDGAGSLGLAPHDVEPVLARLLAALGARLADPVATLAAWRERDALRGREVRWGGGAGVAAGIDAAGRLLVDPPGGDRVALDAGEVHLLRGPAA